MNSCDPDDVCVELKKPTTEWGFDYTFEPVASGADVAPAGTDEVSVEESDGR